MSIKPRKKDAVIEGKSAYWYAKITKYDMEEYKKLSKRISEMIKKGDWSDPLKL